AGTISPALQVLESVLVTADIDGDGDQDVFAGKGVRYLFRNDGGGVFTDVTAAALPPAPVPPAGQQIMAAVPGDFDLDGDIDLFLGIGIQSPPSADDLLLLNDGTGIFALAGSGQLAVPGDTFDAVALDFDDDGDLDLAVAITTITASGLRLFANDGTAHFTDVSATRLPPGVPGGSLLAVDVDGDGDPDLVIGAGGPSGRLLRNDVGTFVDASQQLSPVTSAVYPQAADFDADGDQDLHFGGQWLRNDGLGNFTFAPSTPYAPYYFYIQHGLFRDIDGDGDPDWLGFARNLHRQLENALPPRLGLHGELRLHAVTNVAGFTPLAALLVAATPAASPLGLGPLGTLGLDLATANLHSLHAVPASPGYATVRYLCPATPALVGTSVWCQALFMNGPTAVHWHLSSLVRLPVWL
ncbi:MAG: VCBS repeat-containing protein, partial [Planctomycetota bacterium]